MLTICTDERKRPFRVILSLETVSLRVHQLSSLSVEAARPSAAATKQSESKIAK